MHKKGFRPVGEVTGTTDVSCGSHPCDHSFSSGPIIHKALPVSLASGQWAHLDLERNDVLLPTPGGNGIWTLSSATTILLSGRKKKGLLWMVDHSMAPEDQGQKQRAGQGTRRVLAK